MIYRPHQKQIDFHNSKARLRLLAAGKRGGKSIAGAIESIIHTEFRVGKNPSDHDPYLGIVIAPTSDMLRRLSLNAILTWSKPFKFDYHKTHQEITWHNGSKIYGVSADKPQRLEGVKANWIWIDEGFQCSEQLFLEALARTSDTQGKIWISGSLGIQYVNPRSHYLHKYFKDNPLPDSEIFEWATAQNPYFPKEELDRLKTSVLDPRTYRQMFEIDWNVVPTAVVYEDFDEANIKDRINYNPELETYISIDWGWAHDMACLFFQYDRQKDIAYCFDEIVSPRMTLEMLWDRIQSKGYNIKNYYCDIAGTQEREQTGRSNVAWFRDHNVHFRYRSSAVNYGIAIVRRYVRNGMGQRKLYVCNSKCPKTIDGIKNYSYPEKDGQILNENPIKKNDDTVDALRYFFVNRLDSALQKSEFTDLPRWGESEWQTI